MKRVLVLAILLICALPAGSTMALAQAAATSSNPPPADYLIKSCTETEHTTDINSAIRSVDPAGVTRNYVENLHKKPPDITEFKPTLLQGPRHGTLNYEVAKSGDMFYTYDPQAGFLGKDRAVFMVEYQGMRFKVVIDIHVLEIVNTHETSCPARGKVIRLRKPSRGDAGKTLAP